MSIVKKYTETSLVLRIVIGLVLGTILGLFLPEWTGISILGQLFVGALKAIAPVLVAILVASSVAQANGGYESLLDLNAKDKDTLALIRYIADEDKMDKLLENQQIIKTILSHSTR